MAVKSFNPVTPSRRHMATLDYASTITSTKPEKSLLKGKKASGGRNNAGRITTRFRGGGNKRRYRMVDFIRAKENVPAKVVSIEYDPNRSANIALICYADGEKSYILAPVGLKVGDKVMNGAKAELKPGNWLAIKDIPGRRQYLLHRDAARPRCENRPFGRPGRDPARQGRDLCADQAAVG